MSERTTRLVRTVTDLDLNVSLRLHKLNSGFLTRSFVVFSALGSERVFVPVGLLVAVWSLAQRDCVAGITLVAVTLLTRQSIYVLKALISRSRPAVARLKSSSFPSGHTMAAVAVYGTAAEVIGRFAPEARPLMFLALLLGAMIGLSRVALGFHWATDVMVGFGIGLLILAAASSGLSHL